MELWNRRTYTARKQSRECNLWFQWPETECPGLGQSEVLQRAVKIPNDLNSRSGAESESFRSKAERSTCVLLEALLQIRVGYLNEEAVR